MKKLLLSGLVALIMVLSLFAQQPGRKQISSTGRAKNIVDRISQTVVFTKQQKEDIIAIYMKYYDDVHAQKAFHDASKLESLEKSRDAKVGKLLNNPKLYKQYQDAVKEIKTQFEQRQQRKP